MPPWTPEEIAQLKILYKTELRDTIAEKLGRTKGAVKSKINQLQLKNSAAELAVKQAKIVDRCNKGNTSTRFAKGALPHNITNRKISIRTDNSGRKTYYYHVAIGNWVELHKAVWQANHGKIPAKHVLRFVDGNTLNPAANNLELIPKSLNMLLNSKHNYHPEVAITIETLNQLKKAIHEQ